MSLALIVEDNRINRLVAIQMLKRAGVEGRGAESGADALEALGAERFDLVLMDLQMPGMDGFQTARAIREGSAGELNRNVPIVAMTGYSSAEDEAACYAAGMNGYLAKPLGLDAFVQTVRSLLEN